MAARLLLPSAGGTKGEGKPMLNGDKEPAPSERLILEREPLGRELPILDDDIDGPADMTEDEPDAGL